MTVQHFNTLSQQGQFRELLVRGVCIGNRKTEDSEILLFQFDRCYVEVFFDLDCDEVVGTRSFEDTDELLPYLEQVNLSGILRRGNADNGQ